MGVSASRPIEGHANLRVFFEEALGEDSAELVRRLDQHAGREPGAWEGSWMEHVATLHGLAGRCLELNRRRRAKCSELVPALEAIRAEAEAGRGASYPDEFVCPISFELMRDPVSDAEGNTYDRACIELWLRDKDVSPLTGCVLAHKNLVPNRALKKLIDDSLDAVDA